MDEFPRLKYHQAVFDFLKIRPVVSQASLEILEKREQACGIVFPQAVREWYSLEGAVGLLKTYSNDDNPISLEELGEPGEVAQGYLCFEVENQAVVGWYIHLDGSEDPPVFDNNDEWSVENLAEIDWQQVSTSFSRFVFDQITHHALSAWSRNTRLSAVDIPLNSVGLAELAKTYQVGPITDHGNGGGVYRLFNAFGLIRVENNRDEDTGTLTAEWALEAKTEDHLCELARSVWHLGTLSRTLIPQSASPDRGCGWRVLSRLRRELGFTSASAPLLKAESPLLDKPPSLANGGRLFEASPKHVLERSLDEVFGSEPTGFYRLKLLPGFSEDELERRSRDLSLPTIPSEIRELLLFSKGFELGMTQVNFWGFEDQEILPKGCTSLGSNVIGEPHGEGAGDFFVADVNPSTGEWGPIFFIGHDPAVVVLYAASLTDFLVKVLNSHRSHEPVLESIQPWIMQTWHDASILQKAEDIVAVLDANLRTGIDSLPHRGRGWWIADLRERKLGMGLPWGKFGPDTEIRRLGSELVFALAPRKRQHRLRRFWKWIFP